MLDNLECSDPSWPKADIKMQSDLWPVCHDVCISIRKLFGSNRNLDSFTGPTDGRALSSWTSAGWEFDGCNSSPFWVFCRKLIYIGIKKGNKRLQSKPLQGIPIFWMMANVVVACILAFWNTRTQHSQLHFLKKLESWTIPTRVLQGSFSSSPSLCVPFSSFLYSTTIDKNKRTSRPTSSYCK